MLRVAERISSVPRFLYWSLPSVAAAKQNYAVKFCMSPGGACIGTHAKRYMPQPTSSSCSPRHGLDPSQFVIAARVD